MVTGASGFIGGHLTQHLCANGWQVIPVSRQQPLSAEALRNTDVVFHLAGLAHSGAMDADRQKMFNVNVAMSLELYRQAVAAGVGRFVFLSSIKVLGDVSATPLTEEDPYQPGDLYAESKVAAEHALLQEPCGQTELCVVRPPLVYGPGVGANFFALLRWSTSGWPLPLGSATSPRAWLGIDNLTDYLQHIATAALCGRRIWHVRDNEQTPVRDLLIELRRLNGQPPRLLRVNTELAMAIGYLTGRKQTLMRLFCPLPVDMSSSAAALNWQPPHTQQQQLTKVLDWFQTQ